MANQFTKVLLGSADSLSSANIFWKLSNIAEFVLSCHNHRTDSSLWHSSDRWGTCFVLQAVFALLCPFGEAGAVTGVRGTASLGLQVKGALGLF